MADTTEKAAHSVKSAAHVLDTNERAIYTLIATGELRSFKLGKRRLIPAEEIRSLVARKAKEAAQ